MVVPDSPRRDKSVITVSSICKLGLLITTFWLALDIGSDVVMPGTIPPDVESGLPPEFAYSDVHIETVDGYHLTVYEIYHQQNLNDSFPPIILQHGYGGFGYSWFIHNPEDAAPLALARLGYRVFVMNGRGTSASLDHKNLSYHQPEYWNFTYEDLPNGSPSFMIATKNMYT